MSFIRITLMLVVIFIGGVFVVVAEENFLERGKEEYYKGEYETALGNFQKVYEKDKENITSLSYLAKTSLRLQRYEDALHYAQALKKLDSEHPVAWQVLAHASFHLEKWEKALPYFKRLIEMEKTADNYMRLGTIYFHLGEMSEARKYLLKSLEKDHLQKESHFLLGLLELKRSLGKNAEKQLMLAYQLGVRDPRIFLGLSQAYLLQHNISGKIKKQVLKEEDCKVGKITDDGIVLKILEGKDNLALISSKTSAIYWAEKAAREELDNQENWEVNYILAICWEKLNNVERMKEYLLKLKLTSENYTEETIRLQAILLYYQKDYPKIIDLLQSCREKERINAESAARIYYSMGNRLRAERKKQEALIFMHNALSLAPYNPTYILGLAKLTKDMERYEEAIKYYRSYAELFPDKEITSTVRSTIETLKQRQ